MADTPDLSHEAVERLARCMEIIAQRSGFNAADWEKGAATLRALSAEIARLRKLEHNLRLEAQSYYDEMRKGFAEIARLRAALAEAERRGAEQMRERPRGSS